MGCAIYSIIQCLSSTVDIGDGPCSYPVLFGFLYTVSITSVVHHCYKVRWVIANEYRMTGSIDAAVAAVFPDYRSRRLSHWRKQYHLHAWETIPDRVAAHISQVPNRYRLKGGTAKGPSPTKYTLPPKVEYVLRNQLSNLVEGEHLAMPRAEHVTKNDVAHTLEWLCDKVNDQVKSQRATIEDENKELLQAFEHGQISREELANSYKSPPSKLVIKDFDNAARKFLKESQYTKQKLNTSGNYLDFDDEKMKAYLGSTSEGWVVPSTVSIMFCSLYQETVYFTSSTSFFPPPKKRRVAPSTSLFLINIVYVS